MHKLFRWIVCILLILCAHVAVIKWHQSNSQDVVQDVVIVPVPKDSSEEIFVPVIDVDSGAKVSENSGEVVIEETEVEDKQEKSVDFSSVVVQFIEQAVLDENIDGGISLCEVRNAYLDAVEDTETVRFTFDDIYYLSKIIYAEAGSSWLSEEWKSNVGEVVLNRVASPEFPNTIKEVVYQQEQYALPYYYPEKFLSLSVDEVTVEVALNLLLGERNLVPSVVFQANFKQGGGVYKVLSDSILSETYLCYSNHRDLYE